MTGAFETAAGAFAVVGVADVVVRTGREIYSFLCNVADAPDSMQRLRDSIQEISILAQVCKQCLDKLKTRAQPIAASITPFDSALKALDRELQRLKILIAKFNSSNTTWSRVKYVLDERKIEKALVSLERSKLLLANALVATYGEISTSEHHNIEALVQQCSQQVGLKTDGLAQLLTTKLDAHHQTIQDHNRTLQTHQQSVGRDLANLNAQSQQILATSNINHQAMASKLDKSKQTLSSVLRSQQRISTKQTRLLDQNHKQVALMSKRLNSSQSTSTKNHKVTRDMLAVLTAKVEQLETSTTRPSARIAQSGREIYFLGERRDMIMAYLLSIKDHIKYAIDEILSHRVEGVSARHACWLEREFGELLGSAAQNEAARYSNSTATAFDQWSYSEDAIRSSGSTELCDSKKITGNRGKDHLSNILTPPTRFHSRIRQRRRARVFETSKGTLTMLFPQDKTGFSEMQDSNEIRISFSSKVSQPFVVISAHFFQRVMHASWSRGCVQLTAFTPIPDSHELTYSSLIRDGSIGEVDTAIREGTINPYGIYKGTCGDEALLLSLVLKYGRVDLLDYLHGQGMGVSHIRHDSTVAQACLDHYLRLRTFNYNAEIFHTIIDRVLDEVEDPLTFTFLLTWIAIAMRRPLMHKKQTAALFYRMTRKLASQGYQSTLLNRPIDDASNEDGEMWMLVLIQIGYLSIDFALNDYLFLGQFFLRHFRKNPSYEKPMFSKFAEDVLSVWLAHVKEVSCRSEGDETMSMTARRCGFWSEWSRALQRNGRQLNEVLEAEGTRWLESDDWELAWDELYPLNRLTTSESEDEDGDEDDDQQGDSDMETHYSAVLDHAETESEQEISDQESEGEGGGGAEANVSGS